jgi:purine-binding chemotaxis protein CheW
MTEKADTPKTKGRTRTRTRAAAKKTPATKSAAKAPQTPKASEAPDIYTFADTLAGEIEQEAEAQEATEAWVTFLAADQSYALPVEEVQEVLRVGHITRVPQSPSAVRGVTNLRGRVLAVIDLPLRFGFAPCLLDDFARILVVRHQGRPVGLLVDRIQPMAQVLPSTIEAPEDVDSLEQRDLLRGIAKLEDRLVALLSLPQVLNLEQAAIPAV